MSIDPVSHGVLGQGCESETLIIRTNRGFWENPLIIHTVIQKRTKKMEGWKIDHTN